jgi:hypothetical protein
MAAAASPSARQRADTRDSRPTTAAAVRTRSGGYAGNRKRRYHHALKTS